MSEKAILPYPWQHPTFEPDQMTDPSERIGFCLERIREVTQLGLPNVVRAWECEALRDIRALLDAYDASRQEVATLKAKMRRFADESLENVTEACQRIEALEGALKEIQTLEWYEYGDTMRVAHEIASRALDGD